MLLTITTTRAPATDLGYLLHKHPDRLQTFETATGKAHVFYPEATAERCTAALLLEVDPITLVRGKTKTGDGELAQYVNDRPYAASSMLAVALKEAFRTALTGRCDARPELAQTRPGFGTGRNRITLTLDPLDPASMDQLVDALVPGMPRRARSAVTAQAQGVPLHPLIAVSVSILWRKVPAAGRFAMANHSSGIYVEAAPLGEVLFLIEALKPPARPRSDVITTRRCVSSLPVPARSGGAPGRPAMRPASEESIRSIRSA